MNELRAFLQRIARDQAGRPDLFDALLLGERARYVWHRLRFFAPRVVLRTLLHALEIAFLSQVLAFEYFAPLLSYRAMTALLAGGYWGFLEALRNRVRGEVRAGQPERARRHVESWLSLSVLLAGIAMLSVTAWIRWGPNPGDEPGVNLFDAYGFACVLRFALDLVARTYQAGVSAIRRVYRPFAMSIAPDVLELGSVILAWDQLGPWGFPLSITLLGVLRALLTYRYARRSYLTTRLGSPHLVLRRGWSRLSLAELRTGLVHAAANGSTQLDAALLLLLAHAPSADETPLGLALLFYVLRPLLGAAQSWTRVFYFDWKRLEAGIGPLFQAAFRRMLWLVSVAVALLTLVLVLLVVQIAGDGPLPASVVWLGPFLAARALFALEQLEAFSLGQHVRLARLSALLATTLAVLWITRRGELSIVVSTTLSLFAAVAVSALARRKVRPAPTGRSLPAWLARLGAAPTPLRLGIARVDARVASPARVLESLASALAPWDAVRLGPRHLAWVGKTDEALPQARARVLAQAGGSLVTLSLHDAPDGPSALQTPSLRAVVDPQLPEEDEGNESRASLLRTFAEQHQTGHALDFERGTTPRSGTMPRAARRALLQHLSTRSRRGKRGARSTFDVAVLFAGGAPSLAFLVPWGSPGFEAFRARMRRQSLRDALRSRPRADGR